MIEEKEKQSVSSRSRLFICGTPLQALIIERIIETESLRKQDCILFFYTYVKSEKYEHAFKRLEPLFGETHFYFCDNKFPGYLRDARALFARIDYGVLYFAAVTSSFVLLALSKGDHDEVVTFDDGTANIMPGSDYSGRFGLTLKKAAALALFGNRYYLQKIRDESQRHYTLYPNTQNNVSERLLPISIFSLAEENGTRGNCSLLLGTVFAEYFPRSRQDEVQLGLERFVRTLEGEVFYIPHPRSRTLHIPGCKSLDTAKIAEEVIVDLCERYSTIQLYGFGSSTQVNVGQSARVENFLLIAEGGRISRKSMQDYMDNAGVAVRGVIDLDDFLADPDAPGDAIQ